MLQTKTNVPIMLSNLTKKRILIKMTTKTNKKIKNR